MKRIKRAFKTNETQATAVVFLSCVTTMALLTRANANEIPIWVFACMFFFWPILVFVFNLFNPIP